MLNRLKEFREDIGVDRSDFARRCGVTRQALINVENGVSVPKVDFSMRCVEVLNDEFEKQFGFKLFVENVFGGVKNEHES